MTPLEILDLWLEVTEWWIPPDQKRRFLAKVDAYRPAVDDVPRPLVRQAFANSWKLDVALPAAIESYERRLKSQRDRAVSERRADQARQRRFAAEAPPPPRQPDPDDLVWITPHGQAVHATLECLALVASRDRSRQSPGMADGIRRISYRHAKPDYWDCHVCINGLCHRCCTGDHDPTDATQARAVWRVADADASTRGSVGEPDLTTTASSEGRA